MSPLESQMVFWLVFGLGAIIPGLFWVREAWRDWEERVR